MKLLKIVWQRLVDERGQTCKRCTATYEEIQKALEELKKELNSLGIEVTLEQKELDQRAFTDDPSQSNRIWIGGRPLEEWLGATVGQSPCCDVCGDAECRTVEVDAKAYESIPADLIIKAGLIAASQLLDGGCTNDPDEADNTAQSNSKCCRTSSKSGSEVCCEKKVSLNK